MLRTALSMTCSAIEVTHACILTFDENGELQEAYTLGAEDEQELWNKLLTRGLISVVQYGQRTVNIRNVSTDPRWPHPPGVWAGSAVGIPLMHHSNLRGALLLLHPEIDYFGDEVSEFLEEVAGLIAAASDNARSAEFLELEAARSQRYFEDLQRDVREEQELEQLRRDLASMTYHDLRGLLQNIHSGLSGIDRYVKENRTAVSLLRLATQSTRQMTRMVKGLLDIDRLEQSSAVLNKRRTPLPPLLDEALSLVRPVATEAEQELAWDFEGSLPDVQIDADMITRVLVNLMENAVKHTPPGGQVLLRVYAKRDMVYLSVCDTGPGIPPDHMREVFDKFYRIRHVDAPTGVGLGLAFCRLAIEAHGGRIWVENQPNSGAMFTFTLPLEPVVAVAQAGGR
jgi:signal transduction histidine kinase